MTISRKKRRNHREREKKLEGKREELGERKRRKRVKRVIHVLVLGEKREKE